MLSLLVPTTGLGGDTDPTRSQQAIVDRIERLQQDWLVSSDLRLRVLASSVLEIDDGARPESGVHTRELIPATTLVEWSRGATDPLLLDLLVHRCGLSNTQPTCDALALARRWVDVDAQNVLAWLTMAGVQRLRGDVEAARASVQRASRAPQWHEHFDDLARVVAGTIPRDWSPRQRAAGLGLALGKASTAQTLDVFTTLRTFCSEDAAAREACLRIARIIARDADTTSGLQLGIIGAASAGVDASLVAGIQREADAVRWVFSVEASPGASIDESPFDDGEALRFIERMEMRLALGEVRYAQRRLEEGRIREADAAAAFVATLPESALGVRAAIDRLR